LKILAPRWVEVLQNAGFDAVQCSQRGRLNATDEEIMAYAAKTDFIVLTHDLDFSAILAATKGKKPSVIQIRAYDATPEIIGSRVIAALRHVESELEAGALLTIDPGRIRLRLLPFHNPSSEE
jgi:predicted nuclease of predicted toxin-antitoxin system